MDTVTAAIIYLAVTAADPAALVRDLDADSFAARQGAHAALRQLGRRAPYNVIGPLTAAARRPLSLEQRHRCLAILGAIRAERRRAAAATVDRTWVPRDWPCIDSLWYDTARHTSDPVGCYRRWHAWAYWCLYPYFERRLTMDSGAGWPNYAIWRRATRDWAIDLVGAGCPVWAVELVLIEMRRRDRLGGFEPR